MRFYVGQRFVGEVAGTRHLFETVERYHGGPVEVQTDGDTCARFPTAVLSRMLEAGTVRADHSCLSDALATTPAYLVAERCAACQPHVANVEAPASWLRAVYGTDEVDHVPGDFTPRAYRATS